MIYEESQRQEAEVAPLYSCFVFTRVLLADYLMEQIQERASPPSLP